MEEELRKYLDLKIMSDYEKEVFINEMKGLIEEGDIEVKNGETVYFNGNPMRLCDLFSVAFRFFGLTHEF